MFVSEIAALGAATCWAITGLLSAGPSQHLGALAFNRTRMVLVFAMLAAYVTAQSGWSSLAPEVVPPLLLSGLIGIFLGDTALFLTLNRMGPRRTAMLFSLNAPMSVVLGWLFLGEALSPSQVGGIAVTFLGVTLAILFGKRKSQLHQWEAIRGPIWIGIAVGLVAALSQSVGALIARPIMEGGTDPVMASAVRIGIAALGLVALAALPGNRFKAANPLTPRIGMQIAVSGFLGLGLGMTLLLFALKDGEVGIVSTLSATTPALLLPLLWLKTGERPAAGAWAGAALVVVGSAMIFSS